MNKSMKKGLMLTDATRYSQSINSLSLSSTRKRVDLFGSTNMKQIPITSTYRDHQNPEQATKNNSGMYARVSKLSLEAELLS